MPFDQWPPALRPKLPEEMWNWFQSFWPWATTKMDTKGDFTLITKAKGIVMTNSAGTITKRVRLNNTGTGLIFEDP